MKHVLKVTFQMSVLACLLTLASAYVTAQDSSPQQPAPDNTKVNKRDKNKAETTAEHISVESPEISDAPLQEVLDRIVQEVAKSLDTPMAALNVTTETGATWKSQCGLPADLASGVDSIERLLGNSIEEGKSTVVIEDIVNDHRFAESLLVQEKGIHFCAGEPLVNRNGKIVGIMLVLDTRPRGMSEQEKESLHAAAAAALEALELGAVAPAIETSVEPLLINRSSEKPLV